MKSFFKKNNLIMFLLILVVLLVSIIVVSNPPSDFPDEQFDIHIAKGDSVSSVADELYDKNVISNKMFWKIMTVLVSFNKGIKAGDYRFNYPENSIDIAYRMVIGEQRQPKVSVTIPEGTNVYDMSYLFLDRLTDFDAERFVSIAQRHEGYLFPDTYYFLANTKPEEIVRTMRDNFDKKIASIENEIKMSGKTLDDIINMASLVEKETYDDESRKIVAGILWKRIEDEHPLQVDAPFYYITGKAGNFTLNDLKIDSPYNTYLYKGLPVGPISNPGLSTILDTIDPVETDYWFYLTGHDGEMRYASTFAKHLENKNTYLK